MLKEILEDSNNINDLPSQSEIINRISRCVPKEQLDIELLNIKKEWNGLITLKDGNEVELIRRAKVHCRQRHKAIKEPVFNGVYKVSDELYMCGICLSVLKEQRNITSRYKVNVLELFPINWSTGWVLNYLDTHYALKNNVIGNSLKAVDELPAAEKRKIQRTERYNKVYSQYINYIHTKEPTRYISKGVKSVIKLRAIQCCIEDKQPDLQYFYKKFCKIVNKTRKKR